MRYSKTLLSMSVALALGASGSVLADNVLTNPDFDAEDCSSPSFPDDWDHHSSNAVACVQSGVAHTAPNEASFGQQASGNGTEWLYQDAPTCPPYGLGEWAASGWHDEIDGDTAHMKVTFLEEGSEYSANNLTGVGYTQENSLGGLVPLFNEWARFEIGGSSSDFGEDGSDDVADVWWDTTAFDTNCAPDYAKVSGKAGTGNKGFEGRNGEFSFSGAFGTLDPCDLDGGEVIGELTINFKSLGYQCTFTPDGDIQYAEEDGNEAAMLETEYTCTDTSIGDGDEATLYFLEGDGGPDGPKGVNSKDRGVFGWTAITGALPDDEVTLAKGNVKVLPLEECPAPD